MNEGIAGIVLLGLIGGGGIIIIDWLVIRKIRRVAASDSGRDRQRGTSRR